MSDQKYKIGDKVIFSYSSSPPSWHEGKIIKIDQKPEDYDHDPVSAMIYLVETVEGKKYYVAEDNTLNKSCYIKGGRG